jgi:hypothetical protein
MPLFELLIGLLPTRLAAGGLKIDEGRLPLFHSEARFAGLAPL